MNALVTASSKGEYELFKTPSVFDFRASHPESLGDKPQWVQEMKPA